MTIRDWPASERPREKLLERGPGALSDAELLAIFLRTGVAGMTAVDLARALLTQFGGLRKLMSAGETAFCSARGLGPAKYAQLRAVTEMVTRYSCAELVRGALLGNPEETRTYLSAQLRNHANEVFACLFLDSRHRVIAFEKLFFGTVDGASVHPRVVVSKALDHNASAAIFAHNHPSGIAEPSRADHDITNRLKEALALIDVRVLDHLIIGDQESCSFAELGMI